MTRLRWTLLFLSVCLPLLAVADSVTGDDASETFELLHSQEEPGIASDVGFESSRNGFLAVFRPRTGGVVVEFHRSAPWAHASAVQTSIKNMMDGLLSGPLQASRIFSTLEVQQQQLMSILMQRQVQLATAAAAANPSDQALAYAAMLPRRPCPRHQAMMMMAAQRMEAEGVAAEVHSALMPALAPSHGSAPMEVLAMEGTFQEEGAAAPDGLDQEKAIVDDFVNHDYEWEEEGNVKDTDVYFDYPSSDDSDDLGDNISYDPESPALPARSYDPDAESGNIWYYFSMVDLCQLGYMCLGFSALLLLLVQAMRAQQAQQQALAAHREAELNQPLLYMSPAEVLAAVEKVPGAAVVVESPSGAAMRWENPVYYERLQGKE